MAGGSSSDVCYVNNNGNANSNDAANDWIRPRVGLLVLARQARRRAGLGAHEEGRAGHRAHARETASRWEGRPLLAWLRASALAAAPLPLPMRPGNAGAFERRPCGARVNSAERHAARRARRDAKRAANKAARCAGLTLAKAAELDNLHEAARAAARGVRWKASVQRYMAHALRNALYARRDLLVGRDVRRGFVRFHVIERGKDRAIAAPRFSERVVQKAVTRAVLAPAIWPTLTPGCAANMEGRGTDYSLMRLKRQLAEHHRRHGAEGYVLLMDFADYFGTIDHGAALDLVRRALADPAAIEFMRLQIEANGDIGLGLGSEPNQAVAVALPSPLDRMGERWPGIEASGRYMDDSYFVALDKGTLWAFLAEARRLCASLGITVNERKTRVVKLTRGFTFLKKRFRFSDTGKVIVTPVPESVARIRRRMRAHARMVAAGEMTVGQARASYLSSRGSLERRRGDGVPRMRMDVHRLVRGLDGDFRRLFGEPAMIGN